MFTLWEEVRKLIGAENADFLRTILLSIQITLLVLTVLGAGVFYLWQAVRIYGMGNDEKKAEAKAVTSTVLKGFGFAFMGAIGLYLIVDFILPLIITFMRSK